MAEAVVRYGKDTWAGSGAPAVNHNDANRIKLKSGEVYGFIHAKTPVPPGLTVVSATLTLYVAKSADWSGSKTVTLKRLAERVPFGKLTWNNKPGVTGAAVTATTSSPATGAAVNFDVTTHLQTVANGDPHYGWRLTTDSTTAHRFYGYDSDYPPVLTVEYALSPTQPVDLSPSGGAVSVAKPVLTFDAVDLENPSDMSALQVQIDAAGDFTTGIDFDSGEIASSVPELDLTTTAYAGLADGATTYWRARYKSGEGVWGPWSDAVSFSRAVKAALTIDNPPVGATVTEHTPPILWTFSGTQTSWRVRLLDGTDPTEVLADSKRQDGADSSWTVPKKVLQDDQTYTVDVRVWDDVDRVATPGDPAFIKATRNFTLDDDLAEAVPVLVSVEQDGGTPFVVLTFTRTTAPDSWTILRDGEAIDADVDPADTLVSGTTHTYTDPTAAPGVEHTYQVRSVVSGKSSQKSNAVTIAPNPKGVWLLDLDKEWYVHIAETGIDNWQRTDQVGVYRPVGGKPVQITMGSDGVSGSFAGSLVPVEGRTTAQWRADFDAMSRKPNRTYQLVVANMSIPVKTRNMSATPHPDTLPHYRRDLAKFEFFEVDE